MATVGFDLLAYATLLLKEEDRIHPQHEEDDYSFKSSIMNKRQKGTELSGMKKCKEDIHCKIWLSEKWTIIRSSAQMDSAVVPMFGLPISTTVISL